MGGSNDPDNLVTVSIEEHANLHKQLWEDLGHWQDKIAWQMLSGQITNAEAAKEIRRLSNLGNKHFKGKTHTKEYKEKLSKMMKEKRAKYPKMGHHKPHTNETKEKIRQKSMGNLNGKISGYTLSVETKEKMRCRMLSNNPAKRPEVRAKLRLAALARKNLYDQR